MQADGTLFRSLLADMDMAALQTAPYDLLLLMENPVGLEGFVQAAETFFVGFLDLGDPF